METSNNFWPFRFLKDALIFILFQIANLNRSYRNTCSHFFQNANLAVQIFVKVLIHICVFDENWNPNTFPVKICTEKVFRFRFLSKTQIYTHLQKSGRLDLRFEKNVNTYFCTTCSDLQFEIKWKSEHLSEIWTARNCLGFAPQAFQGYFIRVINLMIMF